MNLLRLQVHNIENDAKKTQFAFPASPDPEQTLHIGKKKAAREIRCDTAKLNVDILPIYVWRLH